MTQGVIYLFIGTRHAVVAAVSLMTLRDWWRGPVALFCDETALPFADPIAKAADATIVPFDPIKLKRHSGFYNKTILPELSPFDKTIQLDLDTLIVDDFGGLWPNSADELVLTRFADWRSDGKIVGGRIRKWAQAAPKLVADKQSRPGPALNTGVISYGSESWVARRVWREVTELNLGQFLGDEQAADLIIAQSSWLKCIRLLDDRWNWSPVFSQVNDDKRIVHGHGSKFFKRTSGLSVWQPYFSRACEVNFGGVRDWYQQDGNKHFQRLVHSNPDLCKSGFDCSGAVTVQG